MVGPATTQTSSAWSKKWTVTRFGKAAINTVPHLTEQFQYFPLHKKWSMRYPSEVKVGQALTGKDGTTYYALSGAMVNSPFQISNAPGGAALTEASFTAAVRNIDRAKEVLRYGEGYAFDNADSKYINPDRNVYLERVRWWKVASEICKLSEQDQKKLYPLLFQCTGEGVNRSQILSPAVAEVVGLFYNVQTLCIIAKDLVSMRHSLALKICSEKFQAEFRQRRIILKLMHPACALKSMCRWVIGQYMNLNDGAIKVNFKEKYGGISKMAAESDALQSKFDELLRGQRHLIQPQQQQPQTIRQTLFRGGRPVAVRGRGTSLVPSLDEIRRWVDNA